MTPDRTRRHRELHALLILDQIPGLGPVGVRKAVEAAGSGARAVARAADHLLGIGGPDAVRAAGDPELADRARRAIEQAERGGMEVVDWRDPAYPARLHNLADPPPVLFLRGRVALLERAGVTVVGARRATARARAVARRLGRELADAGLPVVSGLALGVDGAAHEGALDAGGDTVAVLGRGADRAYPPSHRDLFGRIVERGLIVSEFMPGVSALPFHFPRRNRILAALSRVVVVVEAGRRSGSRITVDHALDLGLDVYAVPGPIDEKACAGSNAMLEEGARALVSIPDFVTAIGGRRVEARPPGPVPGGEAALVLEALRDRCLDAGDVASRAGLTVPRALSLLAGLEVTGRVEQLPGMRFRRAS